MIIFLFLATAFLVFIAVSYFFFYEEPTCFDGKQNGLEDGVDCGGTCVLLCTNQATDPIIHWKRFFSVGPNIYNTIAYVENQNPDAGATDVEYIFKLYDKNNVPLAEKRGDIDIRPNQVTPVIENNLYTGQHDAVRVSFEFADEIVWNKQEPIGNLITIKDQNMRDVDGLPRITATARNNTLQALENIRFIVIVYDINSNAIATSNTIVYRIEKDGEHNIIFTWPVPFSEEATRFEIIPIYDLGN